MFRHEEGVVLFAVCDGVGQSFFGEIAAAFLGDALLDWLGGVGPAALDGVLKSQLLDHLGAKTSDAKEVVGAVRVPDSAPKLLRDALEAKRGAGSQAMFACGRIDLPQSSRDSGWITAAWLGDVRLQVWSFDGETVQDRLRARAETFRTRDRWSTKDGAIGAPNVFVGPVREPFGSVVRVASYTDGLAVLDTETQPLSNRRLMSVIDEAARSPASDDMSMIEVWLAGVPDWVRDTSRYDTYEAPSGQEFSGGVTPGSNAR